MVVNGSKGVNKQLPPKTLLESENKSCEKVFKSLSLNDRSSNESAQIEPTLNGHGEHGKDGNGSSEPSSNDENGCDKSDDRLKRNKKSKSNLPTDK